MRLSIEQRYAQLLHGSDDRSPLATDGYKFSMAQAGFPLRHEEFYLHFRKGGAHFIPFDFRAVIEHLRPRHPNTREQGFLLANGYGLTPAMESALDGDLSIYCQAKGSWANKQEPIVAMSGPSFLVSWMESLAIAFQFPMQVATAIVDGEQCFQASCEDEAKIIRLVWESMRAGHGYPELEIQFVESKYRKRLQTRLGLLRYSLGGDIDRAFEVGTRSMTCMAQHRILLEECKAAGITRTANVKLAYDLYMIPVGTTGHEHQERHGEYRNGFRAVRDLRPEPPSYLFDTYDPMKLGIPAAIETMLEDRTRRCSVRFDSGDQEAQLAKFVEAQEEYGLNLFYLFMDGYDDVRTAKMEAFAESKGILCQDRHYGIGGYLGIDPELNPYNRNNIAMVYKLCQTGGPGYDGLTGCRNVRKYSGTRGKASLAGRPRLYITGDGVRHIIQEGEDLRNPGYQSRCFNRPTEDSVLSMATEMTNDLCRERDLPWENI